MCPRVIEALSLPAIEAAPLLVGAEFVVRGVGGRIVEVEAYDGDDPASHAFRGKTRRNASMFLPGGHIYVYRSYGVHWCMNLVTGPEGTSEAVLLRGLEPLVGIEKMRARRPGIADRFLARGPGNLTKALGVTGEDDGARIGHEIELRLGDPGELVIARRVGITDAVDEPRRFFDAASRCVTRPGYRLA